MINHFASIPIWRIPILVVLVFDSIFALYPLATAQENSPPSASLPAASYKNYREGRGPWSIHVVRAPRTSTEILSVHAKQRAIGLGTLSAHARVLNAAGYSVIGAVNGDFYLRDGLFAGDPRGLQIVDGEILSAPAGTATFWTDSQGAPHATVTATAFQVTWPNGNKEFFGVNSSRQGNEVELYTSALGRSTHTAGGREIILNTKTNSPSLPLHPNETYRFQIREVRETGDSLLSSNTVVISIGPSLARKRPPPTVGQEVIISTAIQPNLRGAKCAISGGPILVSGGKALRIRESDSDEFLTSSMLERHPRTAVGWNKDEIFLVEVDGRQEGSTGMTLNELGAFLVRIGCSDGMNLDGGGSSTLWYDGQVRNNPCDGHERSVANALAVVTKESATRVQLKKGLPSPIATSSP